MKARLTLIAALAAVLAPLKASAQAWVGNPDVSEGVGIRAGNLELHPSLGGEFGYDSNVTRASKSDPGGPVDALVLRITPSLSLSTLGTARRRTAAPPDVAFGASAYAAYFERFPLDSANDELRNARNVALGADARVDAFQRRKLGFDLAGGFVRMIDANGSSDDLTADRFNRDSIRGAAGLTWRPGGGLFEWRAGYTGTYNLFEDKEYQGLNNFHHEVGTRGRWRFLPRSALLFDSNYTFVRYTNSTARQSDGDFVRATVGFHGLVTYHLALLGMVGWGSTFYEPNGASTLPPQQYDSPIGNAEVRWFMQARTNLEQSSATPGLSSIALGYQRSFSNSYLGSFYQRDRGYLQFAAFLLGTLASGLEFGVARVAFPDSVTGPSFEQLRLDARAFAEYRFTETLAANATVQYDQVNSPVVNAEHLDYSRWQAFVGLRWFM